MARTQGVRLRAAVWRCQFHTNDGTVRLDYAIMGSVQTHEEMWPQVTASNGYTFMPGPPLLRE